MPDYFLPPEIQERIKELSVTTGKAIDELKKEIFELGIRQLEQNKPLERL